MIPLSVKTREEAFDFLDGYAEERKGELDQRQSKRPLVKSYMLETVPQDHARPELGTVLERVGCRMTRVDETLYTLYDPGEQKVIGLLEQLLPRYPVIYTIEKSDEMNRWVRNLVKSTTLLDRVWLSGRAFNQLWDIVVRITPLYRFGRLVFQHDNLFGADDSTETSADEEDNEVEELEQVTPQSNDEDYYVPERRSTRFMMIDRLSVLKYKLPEMQGIYNPLFAISQLRFPARGAGGHDFYFDGKATNRSTSFADHRLHLQFVLDIYRQAIRETERTAWFGVETTTVGEEPTTMIGAPVTFAFSEPLSQATFDKFIESTFHRAANRFGLWGNPIVLGPRKVHVYGVDRHLWKPLFLEVTDQQMVVIVPRGTCGNSIHRLVTNVQQYLDPGVKVWVGDQKYESLIQAGSEIRSINDVAVQQSEMKEGIL